MELSIVIPLLNEAESLTELFDWINRSVADDFDGYEVIFIDDGSTDGSWKIIEELAQKHQQLRGIRFERNFGKSQALHAGFKAARGSLVATLDADLQDSPEELVPMKALLQANQLDLVSGWKKKRYDAVLTKNIPSKVYNWAARKISKIELHDFNCGIKLYRKEVVKSVEVYGELHRYIPVLAAHKGFEKIGEHIVQHQARKYGSTKFGNDRFVKGFLDLLTLWFLNSFGKRPMHFFGALGLIVFLAAFVFMGYLGIDKLFIHKSSRLITERPEFFIGLTSMILGAQLFIAGFIGELILMGQQPNRYTIQQTTLDR
ncbi:MAG: glycosyltransferase family 2 protein [Flavobacteriaceae bacterium]